MRIQLKVLAGPDKGKVTDIDEGVTLTVGRGEQCTFRLTDPSVSRVHFEIGLHDGKATLQDKGSSSGTFLNGNRIEHSSIRVGEKVQAGDSRFALEKDTSFAQTIAPCGRGNPASAHSLTDLVGTELGSYRLESVIGRGKTGVVFRGMDREKNREAAVKVLSPHYTADEEQVQRFIRAMKTMLPIQDSHIVKLYNAGKSGPYCWAAMEMIEGENLSQVIERSGIEGMLDWREVWNLAVDIGLALLKGYENHIIHRNVTPTNILRRKTPRNYLLGDFMLAKALEGSQANTITMPGEILGELPYLAPERTRVNSEIDTRSDMYGLGATCYALLTGRPPVVGRTTEDMIKSIRHDTPASPRSFQLSIDELFEAAIMRMIKKDPDKRFDSPPSMIKELLRIGKLRNLPDRF